MNLKNEIMMPHIVKFINSVDGVKYPIIQTYAEENKVPSVNRLTGNLLNLLINLRNNKNVLELGCGIGLSTNYLLDSDLVSLDAVDLNTERINKAKEFITDKRVNFYNTDIKTFLKKCVKKYDFVFVDTIKKDYLETWYLLKPFLNNHAVIIFDDVLLYGFVANEDSEIPQKYKNAVYELRAFLKIISNEKNINYNILPISDGILVINYAI
jgi:predicted O-methyltransferase YrrM